METTPPEEVPIPSTHTEIETVPEDAHPPDTENGLTTICISKEKLLIELVKEVPALYNPRDENYRKNQPKDLKWAEIACNMDWTESQCKAKWKALRDQYSRELKRVKTLEGSTSKWKHFKDLSFLRDFSLSRTNKPRCCEAIVAVPKISPSTLTPPPQPSEAQPEPQQIVKREQTFVVKNEAGQQFPEQQDQQQQTYPAGGQWNIYEGGSQTPSVEITTTMEQITEAPVAEDVINIPDDDDSIHHFLKLDCPCFEKDLILLIKAEPCIYNTQDRTYRNLSYKAQVWKGIACKLKRSVKECRLKWKALRDQYCREYRRLRTINDKKSIPTVPKWKHYDALSFLGRYIKGRSCRGPSRPMAHHVIKKEAYKKDMEIEALDEVEISTYVMDEGETLQSESYPQHDYLSYNGQSQHTDDEQKSMEGGRHMEMSKYGATDNINITSCNTMVTGDDEIEAFFRTVSMKIRNAKMSTVAFTDLQIEILKVINGVMRHH